MPPTPNDCVYAIYAALTNAGVTADMSVGDICDALIAQFTSMTFDGLTGETMAWSDTGEVSKEPKGMVIQGRPVRWHGVALPNVSAA